jgi:endonuclease/exonuclease/phosphatase family metal-dependent hydrolase
VVYAGDFNSDVNKHHAFDGPGLAMRAARVADAEKVAQTLVNWRYNSANLYLRRPPAVDQSIDYVYAGPGVGVASREVVLSLAQGRFVGVIPSDHNPVLARLYVAY